MAALRCTLGGQVCCVIRVICDLIIVVASEVVMRGTVLVGGFIIKYIRLT